MGITQEELLRRAILMDETYEVLVYLGAAKTWQVDLIVKSGKRIEVETQRGSPKMWRSLERALDFVEAYCSQRTKLTLQYKGFRLDSAAIE